MTPATSVTVIDLAASKVLGEIPIAGWVVNCTTAVNFGVKS
ncbi:MAG TPA: hypothetical protein VNE82_07685 [Candidatus Binataceae bacterium]|nr:hypothetical protein [Candidatus Binataceae bacterium]